MPRARPNGKVALQCSTRSVPFSSGLFTASATCRKMCPNHVPKLGRGNFLVIGKLVSIFLPTFQ